MSKKRYIGFTLLKILLGVAIIVILAAIITVSIIKNKKMIDARNKQRVADVSTILSAVFQYSIDNNKVLPKNITSSSTEICASAPCNHLIDLSFLTFNQKYLATLPIDPRGALATNGTGYFINKDGRNHITVTALQAEKKAIISATK